MTKVLILLLLALKVSFAYELRTDNCKIVPMMEWAKEDSRRTELLPRPVQLVIIQHTAGEESTNDGKCEEILRSIRNYNMNKLGWTDIAQSFFVGSNGKIYEGAGWTHVGAHTRSFNSRSIAVSFIGDFRGSLPSPASQKAAQELLGCGADKGHLARDYMLVAHSQLSATLSPGPTFYEALQHRPHWTNDTTKV